jgi:hypothetical protein
VGEKHSLSDCYHTENDETVVLVSEHKKTKDADKKKANFKTSGNKGETSVLPPGPI